MAWLEIRTSPARSVVQSTNHWATEHVRIAHHLYMFYMKTLSVRMYTFHNCDILKTNRPNFVYTSSLTRSMLVLQIIVFRKFATELRPLIDVRICFFTNHSSVHRFLCLASTKVGVNVTCSRPQRNVHRQGFVPGTPWSEIRHPNHCATPPP